MSRFVASVLVGLIFSAHASAQSCPFTNSRFKDLKASSAKLATALAEGVDCQGEADSLSQLGSQISQLAWAIDKRLKETQAILGQGLTQNSLRQYLNSQGGRAKVSDNVIDDICAQVSYAHSRVYASDKHLEAGFGYCVAFSGLINKHNFSTMHKTCFDEKSRSSLKRVKDEISGSNRELFVYLKHVSEQLKCQNTSVLEQLGALSTYAGSSL